MKERLQQKWIFFEAGEFEENIKQEVVENADSQVLEKMSQILLPKLLEGNKLLIDKVKSLTLGMEKLEEENKVTVFESSAESYIF